MSVFTTKVLFCLLFVFLFVLSVDFEFCESLGMIIFYLGAVNFVMFRLLFSDIDAIFHYLKMEEQCGGSLGDFISVDFGSYMDPYAFYCYLLRCAKPLCYGSAYCSNLCLCISRIHIAVSKLLIENPSCYFDAFGKFLIFLNQVSCFVIVRLITL